MTASDDELGPIDYLIVEFPGGAVGNEGFDALLDAVERGVIRLLDVEFVSKDADGNAAIVAAESVGDGTPLGDFTGASSQLLDSLDVDQVAGLISAESVAAVVVYEELSLLPVVRTWEGEGARVVAGGPVLPDDVLEALDASENYTETGEGA